MFIQNIVKKIINFLLKIGEFLECLFVTQIDTLQKMCKFLLTYFYAEQY